MSWYHFFFLQWTGPKRQVRLGWFRLSQNFFFWVQFFSHTGLHYRVKKKGTGHQGGHEIPKDSMRGRFWPGGRLLDYKIVD